ncbi:MAG: hypothetical protein WKI04_19930, partial [Ferruginibacter sp.]
MKLFFVVLFTLGIALLPGCKKHDNPPAEQYKPDVAQAWMQLHIRLSRATTGYNSVVTLRSMGYAGITLYESLFPVQRGCGSLISEIGGRPFSADRHASHYFWPASANAAMARITRLFFESTSDANKYAIDSLETLFIRKFEQEANPQKIQNAIAYGQKVATVIFDLSKTDGGHEAYKHITDPSYHPPTGPGYWIPTPPAFSAPVHPHWGSNRSFILNSAARTQPGPHIPYAESVKSPFYQMVNEVYTISQSLSHEDTLIARFWGDIPGNFNVPAHATNIVHQLIQSNHLDLVDAASVYALHGIALNDAAISVIKTKYKFNLLRPISYIRNVMQKPGWNSVIPTPAYPEYTAAHSVVSAASATVLEGIFGKNYRFSDHTYDAIYGTRSFNS